MYSKRLLIALRAMTAALAITMEILFFYYIFLQFDAVLYSSTVDTLAKQESIFFAVLTSMSTLVHTLIGVIIELGDRLELKGEFIWSDGTHSASCLKGGSIANGRDQLQGL